MEEVRKRSWCREMSSVMPERVGRVSLTQELGLLFLVPGRKARYRTPVQGGRSGNGSIWRFSCFHFSSEIR